MIKKHGKVSWFKEKIRLRQIISVSSIFIGCASQSEAFVPVNLTGNTEFEGWSELTGENNPDLLGFFGNTIPWRDAIAPNEPGSAGSATFGKDSGIGYPASSSIYNFSINPLGEGNYAVRDMSPIADLETIIFQLDLGGDFSTFKAKPVLNYNDGSQDLAADFYSLTPGNFTFADPNEEAQDPLPTFNHAFQWDLSEVDSNINSYEIVWTTGAHSSNYAMQLDSGDTFSQQVSTIPELTIFPEQVSAVPEPSTYAAILGIVAISIRLFKHKKF